MRANGGYTLGYKVSALHRSLRNQVGLGDGIHGLLMRLRHAARASANYVAFQADGLLIADVRTVACQSSVRPDLDVGADPRTHAYAHGKVALATADLARRRYLENPGLRSFTPHTIASTERLDEELRRVWRAGAWTSKRPIKEWPAWQLPYSVRMELWWAVSP